MSHDTRRRDSIVGYGHGEHSATPRARSVSVSMPTHAFLAADLIRPCMCSACPPLHSVRISPDVRLAVETLLLIMGDAPVPARLLASFETLAKWLAPHELKVVIMSHLHRFEVDWVATARLALKRRRGERLGDDGHWHERRKRAAVDLRGARGAVVRLRRSERCGSTTRYDPIVLCMMLRSS